MNNFCNHCGTPIDKTTGLCPKCSQQRAHTQPNNPIEYTQVPYLTPQQPNQPSTQNLEKNNTKSFKKILAVLLAIIIAASSCIGVVFYLLCFSNNPTKLYNKYIAENTKPCNNFPYGDSDSSGVISGLINDYDGNDKEDLILFSIKQNKNDDPYISLELYTIAQNTVTLVDTAEEFLVSGSGVFDTTVCATSEDSVIKIYKSYSGGGGNTITTDYFAYNIENSKLNLNQKFSSSEMGRYNSFVYSNELTGETYSSMDEYNSALGAAGFDVKAHEHFGYSNPEFNLGEDDYTQATCFQGNHLFTLVNTFNSVKNDAYGFIYDNTNIYENAVALNTKKDDKKENNESNIPESDAIEAFKHMLTYSDGIWGFNTGGKGTIQTTSLTNAEIIKNYIVWQSAPVGIYEAFSSEGIDGITYTDEPREENANSDPNGKFWCSYELDANLVDWILENVFDKKADRSLSDDDFYYSGDYVYISAELGGGPGYIHEINNYQKSSDGTFNIYVTEKSEVPGNQDTYLKFTATPKQDSEKGIYWQIHSFEQTTAKSGADYDSNNTINAIQKPTGNTKYNYDMYGKYLGNDKYTLLADYPGSEEIPYNFDGAEYKCQISDTVSVIYAASDKLSYTYTCSIKDIYPNIQTNGSDVTLESLENYLGISVNFNPFDEYEQRPMIYFAHNGYNVSMYCNEDGSIPLSEVTTYVGKQK